MSDPVVTSHHGIAPSVEAGTTVDITIDGTAVVAGAGEFLIAAAERAGVFIPRFCYHPRMKPVGMCRMCLVEVSGPRGATLQPACYIPVAAGMEVVTTSDKVKKAQDGVLEMLLVNHPLDCPVCDKGGECPLQDQVLAYGPGESRFLEEKRHWAKPTPISELVLLDRERCIQCGRCVRFANEVAGEAQIDFLGRGDAVEVNVFDGAAFSSYFSGNTVQICPVGALTATPYRFTARPWDLDQVESTCTLCAFGCRAAVQSSANRITRVLGMDSDPVNQSWLCDKGRFAAEAPNADARLTEPRLRSGQTLAPASWSEALALVGRRLTEIRAARGAEAVGVIGGARLSNEDAYAWAKLAKGVLGTDSVDAQVGDGLPAELIAALPRATIDQACAARCVVVLSGDLREELPVLFLRLRDAVVDGGVALVELMQGAGSLTSFATASVPYRPGEAAAAVRALAASGTGADRPATVEESAWAAAREAVGRAGSDGDGVVVIVGRPSLAEDGALVAEAAAAMAEAWPAARFLPALRRGNVMGAIDMGLAPGLLPGRVSLEDGRAFFADAWGSVPASRGRDAAGILGALADGTMAALVLVGADPLRDFPDATLAAQALARADFVVAVDGFLSSSAAVADVVLPAAIVHERSGTTTNIEGRITRLGQKLVAPGQCWPDWMIAAEIANGLGGDLGVQNISDIWDEIERLAASHAGITRSALDAPTARDGIIAPLAPSKVSLSRRIMPEPFDPMATPGIESVEAQGAPPRSGLAEPTRGEVGAEDSGAGSAHGAAGPARPTSMRWPQPLPTASVPAADSYALRLVSGRRLYDGGVLLGACESLASLVVPAVVRANPHDLEKLGIGDGGPVRVRSARGEVVLEAVADASVPRGVAGIDFNLDTAKGGRDGAGGTARPAATALIDSRQSVVDVRMETPWPATPLAAVVRMLALGDPLFAHGVTWAVLAIVVIKVVVAFAALMVSVMLMIWFERKVISDMQARIGPNRAGPWGLLQTLADGTKLFFKEDLMPEQADRVVFKLAPYLALLPAFLAFAIVPVGGLVTVAGHTFELQVADPPVGILFLLAMSSVSVYGVMLAGWSSGSKYPLLGSVRASAQMISYEAAMGMSVVMVVLVAGTLSTRGIIDKQATTFFTSWNLIRTGVVPFVLFMIAITAELQRPPFDLAEADSELTGGFHTEYSSIRFALFFLAEFMNVITMSAVVVTLFLGGPDGPTPHVYILSWVVPILWFLGKTLVFLFVYVWLRAALPRLRYDQLMDLGWKVLIPLSLGWVLLVAAVLVGGWWGAGIFGAMVAAFALLVRAVVVGSGRNRELDDEAVARRVADPHDQRGDGVGYGGRFAPAGAETVGPMGPGDGRAMSFLSFFGGFKVSLQQMAKTRVTWQYPLEKKPKANRLHGRHVLNRYEDGMEKCIGCELCAGVCPADCIYVRGADNPAGDPVSPGERYGFVYEINYLRCIHCDMCVEACPTEAITETKLFEFSFTNRSDAIYTKAELLVDDDGRPKHLPWEDWRPGDDQHTSAWMRATSPSGNAAYEGQVQWSGELGYGVRAPEGGQSGNRDDAATGIREIRDMFSAHLDDWERNDDQRGPEGVRNRLKHHIALRKASIRIPGRKPKAPAGGDG